MKKILSLILIVLLLSLTFLNGVSATTDEEATTRNHSPIYIGSKPFEEYEEPGFVCGFYSRIGWISHTNNSSVGYLYSPHLLFGWDFGYLPPYHPFPWYLQIAAFSSRVLFQAFNPTFFGIFTGTEPGFICGFVDNTCTFYYGFYPEVMN